MRLSVLGFIGITILAFTSCQKSDTKINDEKMTDTELIDAIQNASNKQVVNFTELPSTAKTTLDTDYAEDLIDATKLAPKLGYEVVLREGSGSRVAAYKQAYFDLGGRELRGDQGDKERCFTLVYPVNFVMPDGSAVTINNNEEMKTAKLAWREAGIRPTLQYPVDVNFKGRIVTVNNNKEIRRIREACAKENGGRKRCFVLVYPVTYIMPDGTEITVKRKDDRVEWGEIKAWYNVHPDVKERPAIQYPVDIKYKDGTVVTINSKEEMRAAREACEERD